MLVWISLSCGLRAQGRDFLRFIYCSDLHYGLERDFRGDADVPADSVSRALRESFRMLETKSLPDDGGVGSGMVFGFPDFIVCTGDIANRMEDGIQSASESWKQFLRDWKEYLDRMYIVPGNHDISNAIGYYKPMSPLTDASSAAGIYNMMMRPDTAIAAEDFDYSRDKTHYAFVRDSILFVFMGMWPDTVMRFWLDGELSEHGSVPALIFTHDPPEADAKHFTNPSGRHDINSRDRFENLLSDTCCVSSTDSLPLENWRTLERYLHGRPQIKAYFHGDCNYNEFYIWHGVDSTISLPVFRVDSPMKGEYSAGAQELLSFIVVAIDPEARLMTVRECLWNRDCRPGIEWGASSTIAL